MSLDGAQGKQVPDCLSVVGMKHNLQGPLDLFAASSSEWTGKVARNEKQQGVTISKVSAPILFNLSVALN